MAGSPCELPAAVLIDKSSDGSQVARDPVLASRCQGDGCVVGHVSALGWVVVLPARYRVGQARSRGPSGVCRVSALLTDGQINPVSPDLGWRATGQNYPAVSAFAVPKSDRCHEGFPQLARYCFDQELNR